MNSQPQAKHPKNLRDGGGGGTAKPSALPFWISKELWGDLAPKKLPRLIFNVVCMERRDDLYLALPRWVGRAHLTGDDRQLSEHAGPSNEHRYLRNHSGWASPLLKHVEKQPLLQHVFDSVSPQKILRVETAVTFMLATLQQPAKKKLGWFPFKAGPETGCYIFCPAIFRFSGISI